MNPSLPAVTVLVAFLSVGASIARSVAGGQDQNYDFVAYHYYLGYSAFNDRLELDYLAAGGQGYQSPLPYALLYLLDSVGIPPVLNAGIHATVHALNLVALFVLTRQLVRGTPAEGDWLLLVSCWLLGAVAPIYWNLVGTSFADLVTGTFVLGGLWLVARSLPTQQAVGAVAAPALILGAVLIGLAVGMRIHNVIFGVALGCALLMLRYADLKERIRAIALFLVGMGAAFVLSFSPRGLSLYREFGNPLFPFFNGVFRSPDFLPVNLSLTGFVPTNLIDVLTLPFRIGSYREWVYAETALPDVRPGLLAVSALVVGLLWIYRSVVSRSDRQEPASPAHKVVMLFFAVATLLWVLTTAHGRYGVILFLLVGPLCGLLLHGVLPRRYLLFVIGTVVLWQAALHHVFFTTSRWSSGPWAARYFDWEIESSLPREPAVYLSFGFKTPSSLAPRLHPASRHANLVGQITTDIDHPGAQRMQRIIDTPNLPIYGVFDFYYTQQADPAARSIKRYFAGHIRRWGLDFTDEPCTLIPLRGPSSDWQRFNQFTGTVQRGKPPEFILCKLRPALAEDRDSALREFRQFEKKLGALLASCSRVLDPRSISIVRVHGQWLVSSFASQEYRLEFADDGAFYMQVMRPPYAVAALGAVTVDGMVVHDPNCDTWFSRLAR